MEKDIFTRTEIKLVLDFISYMREKKMYEKKDNTEYFTEFAKKLREVPKKSEDETLLLRRYTGHEKKAQRYG